MKEKRLIENFNKDKFYLYDEKLEKWKECKVIRQDPFEYPLDIIKVKKKNKEVSTHYLKLVNSVDDFSKDGCVYKVKIV